jgi:predicted nuclease of predicted toxin-antitoxin system
MLATKGIEAVHWAAVGDPRASDDELLRYARERGYVGFTHDLDFGTLQAPVLESGALVTVEPYAARVRVLPIA